MRGFSESGGHKSYENGLDSGICCRVSELSNRYKPKFDGSVKKTFDMMDLLKVKED